MNKNGNNKELYDYSNHMLTKFMSVYNFNKLIILFKGYKTCF